MNVIQRDRRYRRDGRVRPSRRLARLRVRTPRLSPLFPLSLSLLHIAPPLLALGCKNLAPAVFLGPLFLAVGAPPKNPPRPPDEPPRPPPPPISRRASASRARCSRFAAGGVLRRADTRIAPTRRVVAAGALFVRRPGGPTAADDPRRVPEENALAPAPVPAPARHLGGGRPRETPRSGRSTPRSPSPSSRSAATTARPVSASSSICSRVTLSWSRGVSSGPVKMTSARCSRASSSRRWAAPGRRRSSRSSTRGAEGFGSAESSARANGPFQGPIRRVPEAPRRVDRSAGVLGARSGRGGVVVVGCAREGDAAGRPTGPWRCDRRAGSAPIGAVTTSSSTRGRRMVFR